MLAKMLLRKAAATGLVFVASATSNGETITIPSEAAIGDLAFLCDAAVSLDTDFYPSNVTPSGFTETTNSYYTGVYNTVVVSSRKKLVSGDPGATLTGMLGTVANYKTILIFRKSPVISTITAYEAVSNATVGNPAAQSKATQTASYVVLGGCFGEAALPNWATVWYDASITNGYQRVAYKIFNASPATVSVDSDDVGDANFLLSCSIRTA